MMQWSLLPTPSDEEIKKLQKEIPSLSRDAIILLLNRGVKNFEGAKTFFNPKLSQIHDPFLMKDMDTAVDRLSEAFFQKEKIMLYGDYDVDGTCSVSMTYLFLKHLEANVIYYVPDRYSEGYGVSKKGMDHAIKEGVKLIISIDCGIRAIERVAQCNENGIDFIVCDHHEPGEEVPKALAILDPKQGDCEYPYKELCGCGVVYKLLQGFCEQQTIGLEVLDKFIDFLAIATCSDIVPMTGENRALVNMGLNKLNTSPNTGVAALIEKAGFSSDLNVRNVVFGLGPRINAAGRIDHAFGAIELLTSSNPALASEQAAKIDIYNQERRALDKKMTEEALEMIKGSATEQQKKSTVLWKADWHKGVIGIVASRCIENYHRPTIIFSSANGLLTGSARSVGNFSILEAIDACSDLLEKYGGHKFAAGLSLKKENYAAFKTKFEQVISETIKEEDLTAVLSIDQEISLDRISNNFFTLLTRMEPFGPRNMQPVFMTKDVEVKGEVRLLKEEHLKFSLNTLTGSIDCIGFGMKDKYDIVSSGLPFHIAYTIEENVYKGKRNLQLMLRDIN